MGAGFSSKKRPTVVALTPRVLLCWLPSKAKEASAALSELAAQLTSLKFMIFNVSGSTYDASQFQQQLLDVPCPLDFPPSLESDASRCVSPLRASSLASPLNVAVIQGSQDAWQADLLAAALLLFTRFTSDPRTALAFVAFRVAPLTYVPPPPSFVRATHFAAMLLRHEARHNSAPLRLRFLIVHSVPQLDAAGGCRPLLELLDESGALLWSNGGSSAADVADEQRRALAALLDASRRLVDAVSESIRRRWSTAISRCASTHIDTSASERVAKRPMFSRVAPLGVHRRRRHSCCVWHRRSLTCGPSCAARSTTSLRSI
jgi:hypothetical protein